MVWKGRKAAFAAMGRISPNYIVQDGVVPRTALPQVMNEIARLSRESGLRVANVFHAGDGNLHPLVLYDRRIAGQEQLAEQVAGDILRLCIKAGGSITGEHGVGEEKKMFMGEMFAEPDLDTMQLVRCAFDPEHLANPGKVFPRLRLCAEKTGPYTPHPLEAGRSGGVFLMAGVSTPSPQIAWSELESIASTCRPRSRDAVCGRVPERMVEPSTAEQVAAVLRWANENSVAVAPRGNGTKLGWGAPPRRSGCCAFDAQDESRHRARLGRHDRHGRARLHRRRLATHSWRSTDSGWRSSRSLPGVRLSAEFSPATTNGPLRVRFGSLRDLIIGVTLALPDGTLARSGGKVVKNVAGYDLPKLATVLWARWASSRRPFSACIRCRRRSGRLASSLKASRRPIRPRWRCWIPCSPLPACNYVRRVGRCARWMSASRASRTRSKTRRDRAERMVSNRLGLAEPDRPPAAERKPGSGKAQRALWDGVSGLICRFSVLPSEIGVSGRTRAFAGGAARRFETRAVAQAVGVGLLRLDGPAEDLLPIIRRAAAVGIASGMARS